LPLQPLGLVDGGQVDGVDVGFTVEPFVGAAGVGAVDRAL